MKSDTLPQRQEPSPFDWKGILIQQDECVFKIGTDALLLGGWVSGIIPIPENVLDAGTGCGIIALMLGHAFPAARITGIDTAVKAVQLANQNFSKTSWGDRIGARQEDVGVISVADESRFDLVVSNPPYFTQGRPSEQSHKALARHLENGIEIWVNGLCSRCLKGGHICLIVPFEDAFDWIRNMNTSGFFVRDRTDVRSFATDVAPIRSLLHFTQGLCSPHYTQLTIRTNTDRYTREYLNLSGLREAEK